MSFHDPIRQSKYLRQTLSQDKKPVRFFISAGCPLAFTMPKDEWPLIPDVAGLTRYVKEQIDKENDVIPETKQSLSASYSKLIEEVVKSKFDKSVRLGEIETKDLFTRKTDTAWSQLLEAQANRDAKVSIIVFDISLIDNSILKQFENVGYIPGVGLVAIINSQKGDYSNLAIAYMLARDIAMNARTIEIDKDLLLILVNRTIKDINEMLSIKTLVYNNIENSKAILKQLEKSILLMDFNQQYLKKFLDEGTLTKEDLLTYYQGDDVRDKYRMIEKDIENML